ncbi:MAG: hypothetical protein NTU73_05700 [Ignavibacteriae bacterium]|nr:hypothetical protein [Ignavibacteriota bacterium]
MKKLIIVLFVLFLTGESLFSQQIVTPSKNKNFFEIDVSGGFCLPVMDLRGSDGLAGFWRFYNYGMSSGFGTSINTKMSVYTTKMTQLRIYLLLGYSHFSTEDNLAYNVGVANYGWPNKSNKPNKFFQDSVSNGTSYLRLNMPNIGFGLEYAIYTDRKNTSAFNIGADFSTHMITGRAYETSGISGESFNTISSSLRFGVGVNIAYAYKFDKNVGFHVGTRFTMPNLLGRASDLTDDIGYISLLDKENVIINPNLSSGRTMAYFNFFAGMSFYLGKK